MLKNSSLFPKLEGTRLVSENANDISIIRSGDEIINDINPSA